MTGEASSAEDSPKSGEDDHQAGGAGQFLPPLLRVAVEAFLLEAGEQRRLSGLRTAFVFDGPGQGQDRGLAELLGRQRGMAAAQAGEDGRLGILRSCGSLADCGLLPHGEFIEVHKPLSEERRAVLEAKKVPALLPGPGGQDENGVPAPSSRGAMGRLRARANRAFAETVVARADGHDNSHRVGADGEHAAAGQGGEARAAAGVLSPAQLAPGDNQATTPAVHNRNRPR